MKSVQKDDYLVQRQLIETVWKIWDTQGTKAISARNIARVSGYNVAVLYQHFDNLDQLLFLASIRYLKSYALDLQEKIQGVICPVKKYMITGECFNQHVFQNAYAYKTIFMSEFAASHNVLLETYYEIFPEELSPEGLSYYPLLKEADFHERDYMLLSEAAQKGFLKLNDVKSISIANTILVKGMLRRFLDGEYPDSAQEAAKETTRMQAHMLMGYGVGYEQVAEFLL